MTKRILSFILAVLTLFALCAPAFASAEPEEGPAAPAEDVLEPETTPEQEEPDDEPEETAVSGRCGSNVTWRLSNDGTITISGKGAMWNYDWNSMPWYNYRNSIKKIIVQNGVTVIGEDAFYCCERVTSVSLPESVTKINKQAFVGCTSLKTIRLPNHVTRVEEKAFFNCDLTSIMFPSSVTYIGSNVCTACVDLKSVTISNPYCKIEESHMMFSYGGYGFTAMVPNFGGFDGTKMYATALVYGYKNSTAEAYSKEYGHHFRSLGSYKEGWVTQNGKTYYHYNGETLTGRWSIEGKSYYFSVKDGHMLTGLVNTGDGIMRYYSAKDGHMLTGLVNTGGGMRYFSAGDGQMLKGLVNTGGGIRYFSAKTGYMLKGLVTVDSKGHQCYFSAKNGYMLKGLVTTDSKGTKRFFSQSTGYMAKNQWVYVNGIRYYANANGVVTRR